MTVRDHTYYLAQEDKLLGPRSDLEPFLRETWATYAAELAANGIDVSRLDGVSVWWLDDVRHVAVTRRKPEWERSATEIVEPAA